MPALCCALLRERCQNGDREALLLNSVPDQGVRVGGHGGRRADDVVWGRRGRWLVGRRGRRYLGGRRQRRGWQQLRGDEGCPPAALGDIGRRDQRTPGLLV